MKALMRSVFGDLGLSRRLREAKTAVAKDMVFAPSVAWGNRDGDGHGGNQRRFRKPAYSIRRERSRSARHPQ